MTIPPPSAYDYCRQRQRILWPRVCRRKLKADIYFANPYSSWDRRLNENFNRLLRQYIRIGTDLRTVIDTLIAKAKRAVNLRPRKCRGFKQPVVVFSKLRKAA